MNFNPNSYMGYSYTAGFAPYIGFQGCGCNPCA